jgi:hypothetical protein
LDFFGLWGFRLLGTLTHRIFPLTFALCFGDLQRGTLGSGSGTTAALALPGITTSGAVTDGGRIDSPDR